MQGLEEANARQILNPNPDVSRSSEVVDTCEMFVHALDGIDIRKLVDIRAV